MIPGFDEHENLPPGIHHATWTEIVTRYATSTLFSTTSNANASQNDPRASSPST